MAEEEETFEEIPLPPGVGETLRAAREAKGLSLAEVAVKTRITERHLALIEAGELGKLPGRTYAIGFSRNFAKIVGLDEASIAEQVREELALIDPEGTGLAPRTFEPGDPARVPSPALAWFSAFAALVLFIGGSLFVWNTYIAPGASLPWLTSEQQAAPPSVAERAPAEPAAPEAGPQGQVVFTALEQVWVRFYESGGKVLLEKEMLPGESFAVPADATEPKLLTARPDALAITIGGKAVPKLAESQDVMDVPITAQALLARDGAPAVAASPTA